MNQHGEHYRCCRRATVHTHQAVLGDTYSFSPTLIMENRLSFTRGYYDDLPPSLGFDIPMRIHSSGISTFSTNCERVFCSRLVMPARTESICR